MARVRRRELIAGGAAGAVSAALGPRQAEAAAHPRPARVDVVVVGAGLAGLTAARAIKAKRHSVGVLEARRRGGGRNLDHAIGAGKGVELGGEWAGPRQDKVPGRAKELAAAPFAAHA